jgi:hypothetical protein
MRRPQRFQTQVQAILLGAMSITACKIDLETQPTLTANQIQEVRLAARSGAVDTARFTNGFRSRGSGGVFIRLTGEASPAAIARLLEAGARGNPSSTRWWSSTRRSRGTAAIQPWIVAGPLKLPLALARGKSSPQ